MKVLLHILDMQSPGAVCVRTHRSLGMCQQVPWCFPQTAANCSLWTYPFSSSNQGALFPKMNVGLINS